MKRRLVAVDDSAPGFAAARMAVEMAAAMRAAVRAVSVDIDGAIAELSNRATAARRAGSTRSVLAFVGRLAASAGVAYEQTTRTGEVAKAILDEARSFAADLIVIGRSDLNRSSEPYLGSHVRQVLEFSDRPVLIAPATRM